MLKIYKPEITFTKTGTRIQASFESDDIEDLLWFEVEDKYKDHLIDGRADGFVIALLIYAMERGFDIQVLCPMSKKLYYTVNKYLVPLLSDLNSYKNIKVHCNDLVSEPLLNKGGVGTGLSCGIDSFSTIVDHIGNGCPESYEVTYFTFFNVGSHGNSKEKSNILFRERAKKAQEVADQLGKELIIVNSNIPEILKSNFESTHTLRSMSAVLVLQKLFNTYYYSSAVHANEFKLSKNSMGHYDIFNLSMLSTETTNLFSSCCTKTRVDKTRMVAEFKPSYKYLDVCVRSNSNCSTCYKCLRTLFTLELLGKLELYSSVFDLNKYYSERKLYIAKVIAFYKKDIFLREIYNEMKIRNFEVPLNVKIKAKYLKSKYELVSFFLGKGNYIRFKKVLSFVVSRLKNIQTNQY
ncbi:hypothetical protein [Halobacillus andaensis]|uniref:hypothetical protein n=1 Tax=Halobacillus andaensis TaxID=1176239 RepID=UPI003D71E21A